MKEKINPEFKEDLLRVLKGINSALDKRNFTELEKWSNQITHSSAIYSSKRAIYTAIVGYSLSKALDKIKDKKELDRIINKAKNQIDSMKISVEKENFKKFDRHLKKILNLILKTDKSFSKYVEDVLSFSKAHKGAKIHEHGISLSSIAELLGISKWELMREVGETKGSEERVDITDTRERLKFAKKILKVDEENE